MVNKKNIKKLSNGGGEAPFGIPLGNYTSQFFANLYLNELDQFVKHELKAKYYIRYVDDFIILHQSKQQLKIWKSKIQEFLRNNLKLELHKDKSKINPLYKGIDFLGFRIFQKHILLRKRNINKINSKIKKIKDYDKLMDSVEGFLACAKSAKCYKLKLNLMKNLDDGVWYKDINKNLKLQKN